MHISPKAKRNRPAAFGATRGSRCTLQVNCDSFGTAVEGHWGYSQCFDQHLMESRRARCRRAVTPRALPPSHPSLVALCLSVKLDEDVDITEMHPRAAPRQPRLDCSPVDITAEQRLAIAPQFSMTVPSVSQASGHVHQRDLTEEGGMFLVRTKKILVCRLKYVQFALGGPKLFFSVCPVRHFQK